MRKIDAPIMAPRHCIHCPTGHKGGPVIDTDTELWNQWRVYVCLEHGKQIAVAAGFAEGDEMDKLKAAAEALAQAEKGEAAQRTRAEAHLAQVKELDALVGRMIDERDVALGRAEQAEAKLAEVARAAAETAEAVAR